MLNLRFHCLIWHRCSQDCAASAVATHAAKIVNMDWDKVEIPTVSVRICFLSVVRCAAINLISYPSPLQPLVRAWLDTNLIFVAFVLAITKPCRL